MVIVVLSDATLTEYLVPCGLALVVAFQGGRICLANRNVNLGVRFKEFALWFWVSDRDNQK